MTVTLTHYRAGWLVGTDDVTGDLVAVEPAELAREEPEVWPVARVVEVDSWHLEVLCPTCKPKRRNGRPIRHTHGRGSGHQIAEGHRVGHGEACSRGYVVLLLDADNVALRATT